jgi:urease accessory protein
MSQTTLLRLMMLLSPSFPVGGFAYSAGLEQAVADRQVTDAGALGAWLETAIASGTLWNDAVLLYASYAAVEPLESLSTLALALAGSTQRHMETNNLGMAFADAVKASGLPCPDLPNDIAYPVAVGAVALANAIEPEPALAAFLHGFVSNQIQCAIRLGVTGQNGGVALLAKLEPVIATAASRAAQSSLDDLGSNTILADILTMRHETLTSRIFRT